MLVMGAGIRIIRRMLLSGVITLGPLHAAVRAGAATLRLAFSEQTGGSVATPSLLGSCPALIRASGEQYAAASETVGLGAATPSPEQQKPVIRRTGKNLYQVGDVTVDTKERTVTFPGQVNLTQGVLEVLICTEYGKTHESLLSTKVDPLHLNVALLMLGLEGGHAIKYQGDPTTPVGSPVEISFKLKEGEKQKVVRAEDWVYNTHKKRPMLRTHWVYVGSVLTKDGFMAQREGQIATTFHDPFTLIDNPLPDGGDDTVYVVHSEQVPARGTAVTVVIKAIPPPPKAR